MCMDQICLTLRIVQQKSNNMENVFNFHGCKTEIQVHTASDKTGIVHKRIAL